MYINVYRRHTISNSREKRKKKGGVMVTLDVILLVSRLSVQLWPRKPLYPDLILFLPLILL